MFSFSSTDPLTLLIAYKSLVFVAYRVEPNLTYCNALIAIVIMVIRIFLEHDPVRKKELTNP